MYNEDVIQERQKHLLVTQGSIDRCIRQLKHDKTNAALEELEKISREISIRLNEIEWILNG